MADHVNLWFPVNKPFKSLPWKNFDIHDFIDAVAETPITNDIVSPHVKDAIVDTLKFKFEADLERMLDKLKHLGRKKHWLQSLIPSTANPSFGELANVIKRLALMIIRPYCAAIFENSKNYNQFLRNCNRIVTTGFLTPIYVWQLVGGIKCYSLKWVQHFGSRKEKKMAMAKIVTFLTTNVIGAFMQNHFVALRATRGKHRPFFLRKSTYRDLLETHMSRLLKTGSIEELETFPPNATMYRPKFLLKQGSEMSLRMVAQSQDPQGTLQHQARVLDYAARSLYQKTIDTKGQKLPKLWLRFKETVRDSEDPVYIVVCDIKDAFGSISLEKLEQILRQIPDKMPNYLNLNTVVSSNQIRPRIKIGKQGEMCGKKRLLVKKSKTVNIREVCRFAIKRSKSRVLLLNGKRYLIKRGILQGDVLSPALCNVYYGHMIHHVLSRFWKSSNLLVRAVDDILFATSDRQDAEDFVTVMSAGFPDYGCEMQADKLATNLTHSDRKLVFCGIRIDPESLSLAPDVTKLFRQNIVYSIRFHDPSTAVPEVLLLKRLKFLLALKMQRGFLDTNINGRRQVLANLFTIHYVTALRLHSMLDSLFFVHSRSRCFGVIRQAVETCHSEAEGAFRRVTNPFRSLVKVSESRMMMTQALLRVFNQKGYSVQARALLSCLKVSPECQSVANLTFKSCQLGKIKSHAYQKI